MMLWKKINSVYHLRSKWVTLRSDTCRTPEGVIIDPYYVLEYPDWVNIVAFDCNQRVILTKQYRHAVGKICNEIPCGEIEPGESPLHAARRELKEETGYISNNFEQVGFFYPNPARQNNKVHCFAATDCTQNDVGQRNPSEVVECQLCDIPTLLGLIDSGHFTQGLHVACVLTALRKLRFIT